VSYLLKNALRRFSLSRRLPLNLLVIEDQPQFVKLPVQKLLFVITNVGLQTHSQQLMLNEFEIAVWLTINREIAIQKV